MKRFLTTLCGLLSLAAFVWAQQPASEASRVSVGGITFFLADGYAVKGRSQQSNGEAVMICPENNPNNDRLILIVRQDVLAGINGLTSEEVSDMLTEAVNGMAGVIANTESSGYKLDKAYRVRFEDDPNCPTAYSTLSGTDKNGKPFQLSAEAVLVHGDIISGCAIASRKDALDELVDIYREAVAGEDDVPQGLTGSHLETAGGFSFEMPDNFSITDRDPMDPGEGLTIVPTNGDPDIDQMYLLILPDILPNAADVPAERLSALLESSTRKLADVVTKAYKFNGDYDVKFDDSRQYPIAYANLKKGSSIMCHAETALVNGSVIGSCAVASSEKLLSEMVGIYEDAVGAALRQTR